MKNTANRKAAVAIPPRTHLVPALLRWFDKSARDLPWRRTADPYAIWVAEIMLQQTQVKTVLPYWERWMRALPTIESLAVEKVERLLKLWEGLGYYRRVRNMQMAAQQIVRLHGGKFPRDFDAILALPGIGPYTAGAIASIAFNQPKPILDGNVIRVLSRCFGVTGNARAGRTNKSLWQMASDLVLEAAKRAPHVERSCSRLNQSLMELGALVCLPREPQCAACPLLKACVAHRRGLVNKLPNLGGRPVATPRRFVALVLEKQGRFLVRQRSAEAVNALLWEFPTFELANQNGDLAQTSRKALGLPPRLAFEPLCTIKHSITRYRITLEALRAKLNAPAWSLSPGKWLTPKQMDALPFASAHRRILMVLRRAR